MTERELLGTVNGVPVLRGTEGEDLEDLDPSFECVVALSKVETITWRLFYCSAPSLSGDYTVAFTRAPGQINDFSETLPEMNISRLIDVGRAHAA